ncbi:hypothetical protein GH714_034649 [Hevea brasiliensis]|uniref:Arf-GAP domain-containing protein n=1 Tax=Hevea brasiliensis TaxID=3981 RepID=A0A6A6KEL4_HEVBR|nr:hypothetical protein GH714_034649 [Hevea brasiliensis]
MANRVKEDEKNERIIRGLLKLSENRRCINCNSLVSAFIGLGYVNFNPEVKLYWDHNMFAQISGLLFAPPVVESSNREFTHRVKSVSMAKFTSQEVVALQEGGNKRAREIYLKEWDPQRHSAPDGSSVDRLRDFIKHVYVDRRYTGERNYGKPPSVKLGDKEDSYQGGSRSPPYEDTYERRYSEMSSPGGRSDDRNSRYGYDERSPGYDQENRQYNDYRRSPTRAEIVNDWRREDRFGNGKRADERRVSDGDSKLESRSPERLKDPDASSPPIVRPVREILGGNVVPLRISEPPKTSVVRAADGSAQTQTTVSSSSLGSTNGNLTEVKAESTASLIDFYADPEPPVKTAVPQAQQTIVSQSIAQLASTTNNNNWASFDFAPEVKASQAYANTNPLESVLSQMSVPASVPGQISGMPSGSVAALVASVGNAANLPSGTPPAVPAGNAPILPLNTAATMFSSWVFQQLLWVGICNACQWWYLCQVNETGQWPSVQHRQPFLYPASSGQSTQQFALPFDGASANQSWNLSVAPIVQAALSKPSFGALVNHLLVSLVALFVSQPPAMEVKSNGRKELPQDLFAATYPSFHAAFPGWQTGPPRGMGFAMQYSNTAAPMPTFVQPSKSTNPFDLSEPSPVQGHSFPSMASLQSALPNMPPSSGLQHTSSLGAYMGQVSSNMPLSRPQGVGGFSTEGGAFGAINMDQRLAGRFSAPATPSPFSSVGGNPFG